MVMKIFFDELDEKYDNYTYNDLDNLFNNSYADKKYILVGSIQRWDGKGYGHCTRVFDSIIEAIKYSVDGWGSCYLKIYEENYGRLYIQVSHHDGTNLLEVRELTSKGEQLYYNNFYDGLDKVVEQSATTRNVKFSRRYT